MQKWEYIIYLDDDGFGRGVEDALEQLGEDGFDLVTVYPAYDEGDGEFYYVFILKRPIEEPVLVGFIQSVRRVLRVGQPEPYTPNYNSTPENSN